MNRTKTVSFKPIFVELPTVAGPVGVGYQKRTVGYQNELWLSKRTGKPILLRAKVSLRLGASLGLRESRESEMFRQING